MQWRGGQQWANQPLGFLQPQQQSQQLALMPLAPNATPPKPTQLPTQPLPNLDNKPQQQHQVYSANPNQYLAYSLNISDIHLRSKQNLPTPSPPFITELPSEETTLDQPRNSE